MPELRPVTGETPRWTKARPVDGEDREAEVAFRIKALVARALGPRGGFRVAAMSEDPALDAAAS